MIVLDTTVLVYAVGEAHPLREPCRRLIEAIAEERLEATTTVEVVQEFVHVRARRRDRRDAAERGRELLRLLGPLIRPGDAELALGLRLFEEHEEVGMFDAVLAAAAMLSGADALVSADRAFATVRGLPHLDPGGPEVRHLAQA
ncbi:MAG: PIN domain-containing protein [Chloroflexota bacterium]